MAYHLTLLFLVYTEPQKASMFFIMSIACAYLLALAWLGSFAIMAVLGCGGPTDLYLCGILVHIPQQPAAPQTLQFLLTPFECIIMADLAVRLSIQRRDAWKSMGYKGKMFVCWHNRRRHRLTIFVRAGTGEDDCDTSNDSTECR